VAAKPNPELEELLRRGEDFEVFVEEILGIRLNRAQKRIARRLKLTNGRAWPLKTLVTVAANQIGKTLIQACIILWACMYKIGVDPSDKSAWEQAPYLYIHLGPVQQQAYHALKDCRLIMKGEHPSQDGRSKLPKGLVQTTKIDTYYDGLTFWHGAQAMFRTAENKGEAILGYRAAAISVDEAAFVDHLTLEVNEVLKMRLISTGGPIMLFSTPNGMNDFFDAADAIKTAGTETEDMVWSADTAHLVWAVIDDNKGYGISAEEVERMERELNPATKEQQLRGAFLEPSEAFFVPQDQIIKVWQNDLPDEQAPIPGHLYAIFWDPSISSDPTAAIILDVTKKPWQGVWQRWFERPLDITRLIGEITSAHGYFHNHSDNNILSVPTRAVTGFDATSMGGAIVKGLLAPVNPKRPVNFGGSAIKVPSLTNLRDLMTKGDLQLPPSWTGVRQEVLNYRLKDDKIRQDRVMALMGAAIVGGGMTMGLDQKRVDPHSRVTQRKTLVWG
jgi:hypothetical protein